MHGSLSQTKAKLAHWIQLHVSFCSNSTTPLDIVAIDNLPSLLPRESSIQFANSIMPYLLKLPEVDTHPVWVRAGKKFEEKAAEVLYHNVKC